VKKQICLAAALFILFLAARPLMAADQFYVGIKGGLMRPDAGGYDDAVNAAILLGLEFVELDIGSIDIEGEYTDTIFEGDASFQGIHGEWDIETYAIYGVLRTRLLSFSRGKLVTCTKMFRVRWVVLLLRGRTRAFPWESVVV
jgi:hypothetical protein